MNLAHDIRVSLLDGFDLRHASAPTAARADLGDLPRGVQRLVACLCLSGRPARTAVAGLLWPDLPEERAQGSLRSALWRLQKSVPGLVDTTGGALTLTPDVRVDVWEFRDWARLVLDPRTDAGALRMPGDAFLGELLPGWYDDWVLLEREQLRQLRMHALEALAQKLAAAGRHGEAVQAAYAAVRAEPMRESAHRVLISVHIAQGNVGEAARAYEAFRTLLADELGVQPTAQMADLLRLLPHRVVPRARTAGDPGPAPAPRRPSWPAARSHALPLGQ